MKEWARAAPVADDATEHDSTDGSGFFQRHRGSADLLVLMWWLQMSPWILTRRDSYVYHYLLAYSFGLLLVVGALAHGLRRRPRGGLLALTAVAAVAEFYAPVGGQRPISPQASALRLFLPSWR